MQTFDISFFRNATPTNHSAVCDTMSLPFDEIHTNISNYTWSPTTFKDNYRKSENFISASLMVLDIDSELTIEKAHRTLKDLSFTHSITLSKSHQIPKNGQAACDRFRIVIPLKEKITDINAFAATWQYLYRLFPECDTQCKDPSRYYFESQYGAGILYSDGNELLTVESIERIIEPIETEIKERKSNDALVLKSGVQYFINNAQSGMPGNWNCALMVAAKECVRGGFEKDQAIHFLQTFAPNDFDDKDRKAINSGWKAGARLGPYAGLKKIDKKEMDEQIYKMLDEEFEDVIHIVEDDSGRRGLILMEEANGLVKPSSLESLMYLIGQLVEEQFRTFLTSSQAKMHAENYILHAKPLKKEPQVVAFKDDRCLAYHKLDFNPQSGDCPLFDELINRSTNSEALMAFIWSLFVLGADRQQYIWLCGEGGNGKTSLQRLLERLLGKACTEKRVGSMHGNRFFTHSLIGKRLAIFSDTNSSTVVRSETVKEITGGGRIEVEPKGMSPYTINIDVKLMFISNNDPDISSKNADRRRLIMCKLLPLPEGTVYDPDYVDLLWEEIPAILYRCKTVYESLGIRLGNIPDDSSITESIATDSEIAFHSIFDQHLDLADDVNEISYMQMYNSLRHSVKSNGIKFKDFTEWLLREYSLEVYTIGKRSIFKGIVLK